MNTATHHHIQFLPQVKYREIFERSTMPKFAVLVHASKESEASQVSERPSEPHGLPGTTISDISYQMPKSSEFDEMDAFNKPYFASGAIIDADGFLASSKGTRVTFSEGSEPKLTPGPFELGNLVAGYWILKLESMEEAIKFAKGIPFKSGGVDIRQIAGPEDFGDALTEEQKERWGEERTKQEEKEKEGGK